MAQGQGSRVEGRKLRECEQHANAGQMRRGKENKGEEEEERESVYGGETRVQRVILLSVNIFQSEGRECVQGGGVRGHEEGEILSQQVGRREEGDANTTKKGRD